jgi:hypothetical protein
VSDDPRIPPNDDGPRGARGRRPRPVDPRWITLIDAELFRAAQAGDTAAREELWHRLVSVLYAAATRYGLTLTGTHDAARDLAGEAWMATYEETNARLEAVVWKGSCSLVSFVWRCLTWRCRDAARRRRRVGRRDVARDQATMSAQRETPCGGPEFGHRRVEAPKRSCVCQGRRSTRPARRRVRGGPESLCGGARWRGMVLRRGATGPSTRPRQVPQPVHGTHRLRATHGGR